LRRTALALLLCAFAATPAKSSEDADRVVAAFTKICLARPDSMSALNRLATAEGFALDKDGAAALAGFEGNRADPFSLLLFWTVGPDKGRMRLTGLIDGKTDRYELGCIVDGFGVPPRDALAALKTLLGEPTGRTVKETQWVEFAWAPSGDARRGTVTLAYSEVRQQRVGLTLVQHLGVAPSKAR
jgi:hypothetical protein